MAIECKAMITEIIQPTNYSPQVDVNVTFWFEDSVTHNKLSSDFVRRYTVSNPDELTAANLLLLVKNEATRIRDLAVAATNLLPNVGTTVKVNLG